MPTIILPQLHPALRSALDDVSTIIDRTRAGQRTHTMARGAEVCLNDLARAFGPLMDAVERGDGPAAHAALETLLARCSEEKATAAAERRARLARAS